jgi:hypothetical protein
MVFFRTRKEITFSLLLTSFASASNLESSDAFLQNELRNQSHSHHPQVEARGNAVRLETRGNHDYYGHMYVG